MQKKKQNKRKGKEKSFVFNPKISQQLLQNNSFVYYAKQYEKCFHFYFIKAYICTCMCVSKFSCCIASASGFQYKNNYTHTLLYKEREREREKERDVYVCVLKKLYANVLLPFSQYSQFSSNIPFLLLLFFLSPPSQLILTFS